MYNYACGMSVQFWYMTGFFVWPIAKLIMKNDVCWDVTPRGSCKDRVSEERSASIVRVTRISELGTLAVTSNCRTLRTNTRLILRVILCSYKSHMA
jgi:hypothetical protein